MWPDINISWTLFDFERVCENTNTMFTMFTSCAFAKVHAMGVSLKGIIRAAYSTVSSTSYQPTHCILCTWPRPTNQQQHQQLCSLRKIPIECKLSCYTYSLTWVLTRQPTRCRGRHFCSKAIYKQRSLGTVQLCNYARRSNESLNIPIWYKLFKTSVALFIAQLPAAESEKKTLHLQTLLHPAEDA